MQIKSSFLATLLFLTCFFVSSQTLEEVIEYTKNKLNIEESIKTKAKLSGDLSWYYATLSVDSSYKYGYQSLEYAKQVKNDTLIAQAYNDLGTVYFIKGDYITSQEYCKQSYEIRKIQKDFKGLASLNVKIANNFNRMAQYDSSMFYYFKAHNYFEEAKDMREKMNIESNISAVYYLMGNNEKALDYLQKPIEYYDEIEDYALLSNAIANLGNIYYSTGDTINAVKLYERAVTEALKVNNYHALGVAYNNLGEIYSKKKQQEKAINYILKSIKIREGAGSEADLASSYLTLAFSYFRMREFDKAKVNLLRIVPVFENSKSQEKLDDVYLLLSYIYAVQGKLDSLNYYSSRFYEARSNNIREQIINSTQDIETKYQTEKKEKELLESRAVIAENELKIRRKNTLIYGTSALTLLLAILGYLLYQQQKLKNRQLQKENELREALNLIETQNKLQEQRLRISRDLHDNIGSQLTFIISALDNIKYAFKLQNEKLGDKIKNISEFTSNTIFELRDTIWAMNKPEISLEDLKVRITNFIDKARESSENIHFNFGIDKNIPDEISFSSVEGMNVYRIIQEAVHNALKYADAKSISVQINQKESDLEILISDDGVGYNKETVEMGNGINNMKKRAKEIKAQISMNSILDAGTTIHLTLKKAMPGKLKKAS